MALVACYECGKQISDAAVACPSCGHPLTATQAVVTEAVKTEKAEIFKAGGANLVLAEIAALSCLKTRNWVYLLIGVPILAVVVYAWLKMEWPLAVGVTVVGFFVLAFIHTDAGRIASTGNVTDVDEDMDKVTQRYHQVVDPNKLVVYQGRNFFQDMHFSINPVRIAEFSQASYFSHIWLYLIGVGALVAADQYNVPVLYIVGGALLCFGFLSRKAALTITGVGGAKMVLYTKAGDIKKVIQQLTSAIENC
ncbi:zinc ribbon domain-containing protein [Amphritea sp.]|uniref:zinc ribbon domain-containing protein n=1 Tax=Amphritea sp. TaxID=1872502 RepID=UPI003A90C209